MSNSQTRLGNPEMAWALLDVEKRDEIQFSFISDGDEHTTRQKVVDVADHPYGVKIYCEESPGWNGPSVSLVVHERGDPAVEKELQHPMSDPTVVDQFTDFEVIEHE